MQQNSSSKSAPRKKKDTSLHCGHLCQDSLYRWCNLRRPVVNRRPSLGGDVYIHGQHLVAISAFVLTVLLRTGGTQKNRSLQTLTRGSRTVVRTPSSAIVPWKFVGRQHVRTCVHTASGINDKKSATLFFNEDYRFTCKHTITVVLHRRSFGRNGGVFCDLWFPGRQDPRSSWSCVRFGLRSATICGSHSERSAFPGVALGQHRNDSSLQRKPFCLREFQDM